MKPKKTILCVDSNEQALSIRKIMLETRGYRVVACNTGEAALEVFRRGGIDLVLSDLIMPGLDGALSGGDRAVGHAPHQQGLGRGGRGSDSAAARVRAPRLPSARGASPRLGRALLARVFRAPWTPTRGPCLPAPGPAGPRRRPRPSHGCAGPRPSQSRPPGPPRRRDSSRRWGRPFAPKAAAEGRPSTPVAARPCGLILEGRVMPRRNGGRERGGAFGGQHKQAENRQCVFLSHVEHL